MFISYQTQGGITYARLAQSYREGGRVKKKLAANLGRILDKERGIYQSRERGVFTFDLATGAYGEPPPEFVPAVRRKNAREKLIVDFGDAFLFNELLTKFDLRSAIDAICYGNQDSVYALLLYYMLEKRSNSHAQTWFEGSYARCLYPKAVLTSQSISRLLSTIGEESHLRAFFKKYFSLLGREASEGANILIDCTGLPNSIRFPLTAISNHNGQISEEVRLIYVVQQNSRLPIYMRYVSGNVIDTTTLSTTVKELKAAGVNTKFAILDAGYLTAEGMTELFAEKISFLSRCPINRSLYREAVAAAMPDLESAENLAVDENGRLFNNRQVYIKRVELSWKDTAGVPRTLYAYVGKDKAMQEQERRHAVLAASRSNARLDKKELHEQMLEGGLFVLIGSRRVRADQVLSQYYVRQEIEQVFDIAKNYASLLPLNVENENTFRGHLLMTFIATAVMQMLQMKLQGTEFSLDGILARMRTQKAKLFPNIAIPCEPVKAHNDIYKLLSIKPKKEYVLPNGVVL